MARPTKDGLDYFPLDIDIDQDDKLVVPIAKYGMQGLGIIVKIMMEVYRNGYFYTWGEREQYVFANKVNVDINTVIDVINECIKWGFFNQKLFNAFGILTSKGFQNRYLEASKRRKNITFIDIYTLIDLKEASTKMYNPIHVVDTHGNRVNVYINPDKGSGNPDKSNIGDAETPQSKVKESKVNKSIKDIKKDSAPPTESHDSYPSEFEDFWKAYPRFRRKDKAKTFVLWKKKIKAADRQKLIDCTSQYAMDFKTIGTNGEFSKAPSTYLNAETWKDYLPGVNENESGSVESNGRGSSNNNQYNGNGETYAGAENGPITVSTGNSGYGESGASGRSAQASTIYDEFVRR